MPTPVGGVMTAADTMSPTDLVAHVRRLESLGYRSVWITDVFGREIYATAAWLLAHTERISVATGIAHIYGRDAIASAQAGRTLAELSGGRFIQGLGVSHPVAAEMRGVPWEDPADKARAYITTMRETPHIHTPATYPPVPIYLSAHGPRMLAVAADVADGANSYMQAPAQVARAREILGPDKALNVVLPCCLTTDPEVGRSAARRALSIYLPLPAYHRAWRAQGFDESDWSDRGSDRLVAAFVAWGAVDRIRGRMQEHLDAGATEIEIGALPADRRSAPVPWDLLEAVAPGS